VDNGSTASYVYDANGQRVRKTTSSGSVDYLYDLASHEITELSSSGSWNRGEVYAGGRHLATYGNSTTYLIHADHLGTERVRTNSSGTSCETVASLPFGDWQTTSGSCGDPSPMHFTGKERDSESGLDNFGARYDSSSMGRFMSPDPMGGHPQDPQTLNRYAYVRNNPVSLTDPTGLDFYLTCQQNKDNGSTCQGGHVGTSDDKGNFTATVVTSDSIRNGDNSATVGPNGVEVTTGGKTYTGEYFENPDSIKMENVNGESTFVDHNQITLGGKAGSGLENFSFFVNGNCSGTCLASGTFDFNSTPDQTQHVVGCVRPYRCLGDRTILLYGASLDEDFFQRDTTQHRFGLCPLLHVSVPRDPKATVPTMGLFHVDKDAPGLAHAGCAWFGVGCH
jgi:RHS repeat-associated protein